MFQLIGNLLDVGAIEQGKFPLVRETLDLKTLLTRAADAHRRQAADKRIRLDVVLPPGEAAAQADARVTLQVANNLISNALKFTPLGGAVIVTVDRAQFAVGDTGPGLSPEDQGRLFQKYVRLAPRSTAGEHSTGLGLSIVKQLVEVMGGTVQCRSEVGRGTTFAVGLPTA